MPEGSESGQAGLIYWLMIENSSATSDTVCPMYAYVVLLYVAIPQLYLNRIHLYRVNRESERLALKLEEGAKVFPAAGSHRWK